MPKTSAEYEQAQRERLLDGAAQVFAAHGYSQTTMDQIAISLGVSKGAIYIYFKTKEELFTAAIRAYNQRRIQSLQASDQPNQPVMTRLDGLLERFSDLLVPDNQLYIRLWLEGFLQSAHIPALQEIKSEIYQQSYQLLFGLLTEGQHDGTLVPTVDVDSLVVLLLAAFDGLMLHALIDARGITPDRVRQMVRATFYQLLTPVQLK